MPWVPASSKLWRPSERRVIRTGVEDQHRLSVGEFPLVHSKFHDTDAVRFPANCVTKWHWWGGAMQTTNRNGASSRWMKIPNIDHVYIDSILC